MKPGDPLPAPLERLIGRVLEAAALDFPERADVEADLRAHFEDGLAAGVSASELERAFGDPSTAGKRIARARRTARRAPTRGRGWVDAAEVWTELRHAMRRLGRAPGFAAIVILTLALGVGANTAIFTVLNAVVLEPLPYRSPERLVRVYEAPPDDPGELGYLRAPTSAAYRTWGEVFESFAALYTYREQGADLTDGDVPLRITLVPVTAGYFETLGVAPVLGRTFEEDESFAPGNADTEAAVRGSRAPVTILSHGLWERHFAADPSVLGRIIHLNDVAYEVVGVMPPGFDNPFGSSADAWVPQDLASPGAGGGGLNNWGNYYLSGVGRLRDGLSLEAAQERATALYGRLEEANPEAGDWGPRLVPLHADLVGSTRQAMLWILTGAAALVLLTACLNVANLVFARGLGRDRDVALRAALGSGRRRILAGVLTENALLAIAGGAVGLLLGWAIVHALLALSPDALPRAARPEIGATVFLFTLSATAVALLAFGLAPAWRMARTAPADVLRSGDRAATGGRRARRIRDILVVTQVAAALVLVTGAALLARSFGKLTDVTTGVEPEGVLTFEVHLPAARYPSGDARHRFHERLWSQEIGLPSVQAAGAVSWLPLSGRYHSWGLYWDAGDAEGTNDDSWYETDVRVFSGDYFDAVGLRILRGDPPKDVDLTAEPMAWIAETTAGLFGDVDPVGQKILIAGAVRRVMGIVEDAPVDARGRLVRVTYVPHAQHADNRNWALIQVVKASGDPASLREEIRVLLAAMDPSLVLHRAKLLDEVVATARSQDRFATVLMGAFALLAWTLSLVGTYGALAGSVASRRREIGVRMALGADAGLLRGMVLRYAASLMVPGIVIGLGAALVASRLLDGLLFGVASTNVGSYAAAALVFLGAGLLSGWLPARRATRVDTGRVLGAE